MSSNVSPSNSQRVAELRWQKLPVLDDGFVTLVDCMGDDSSVVEAARVSYGAGTRRVSDDRGLIRYLMRHRHTTPFEMAEIKLLVRVPMDTWRQWIRHRSASVNEYSTRYSVAIDAAQATPPDAWRSQSASNRQGSEGLLDDSVGEELSRSEAEFQQRARELYDQRLQHGVAREQARKDLPLSTYTEAYWKIDLHNLLHFLALRMDAHAQWEIRQYATVIGEQIVRPLFPLVWEAFVDYRLEAMYLTRLDRGVIERLVERLATSGRARGGEADFLAVQDVTWQAQKRNRERDECRAKLQRLGLLVDEGQAAVNVGAETAAEGIDS
ncbi:MAG: FAD-dependent thymidylate synthase [Pirellulales bacterium]|nr:FAD-dependent thymidylate synthase [Pirellulales bacterium]